MFRIILLSATTVVLLSFGLNDKDIVTKKITVTGIAENAKAGAILITTNGPIYLLEGVDKWEDTYYGKKVKVTGRLRVKESKNRNSDSRIVATWGPGVRYYIKKPEWSLAD